MYRNSIILLVLSFTILATGIVIAYNPNYQNILTDIIIGESVDYEFFLYDQDLNMLDCTGKLAYFRVKRNASDSTYKVNVQCEINMFFKHTGIHGSMEIGDSITGNTSAATGVIQDIYEEGADKYIVIDVTTGTFQSGEQVYETLNTNYVVLSSSGINSVVNCALTPDQTTYILGVAGNGNIVAADHVGYVQVTNAGGTYNKYGLKSNLKFTN